MEQSYETFYKLHSILKNNPEVLYHIADIQEQMEENSQALEWYMQVRSQDSSYSIYIDKPANSVRLGLRFTLNPIPNQPNIFEQHSMEPILEHSNN